MTDLTRGPDAADQAPKPKTSGKPADAEKSGKQDAPNYDDRIDRGLAEPVEKLNSANDE